MGSILPAQRTPTNHPKGPAMNEWTDVVDLTDDELQQINKHINRK